MSRLFSYNFLPFFTLMIFPTYSFAQLATSWAYYGLGFLVFAGLIVLFLLVLGVKSLPKPTPNESVPEFPKATKILGLGSIPLLIFLSFYLAYLIFYSQKNVPYLFGLVLVGFPLLIALIVYFILRKSKDFIEE